MSEETKQRLGEAALTAKTTAADLAGVQDSLLDQTAKGLPESFDQLARRVSGQQPDITKALGRDGVRSLREEMASKAVEVAAEVRQARSELLWPESSEY